MKKSLLFIGVLAIASLATISCKKKTTPAPTTPTPTTPAPASINSAPQVSYNITGGVTSGTFVSNGTSIMDGSSSGGSLNAGGTSTKYYSSDIYDATNGNEYLNINKGTLSYTGGAFPDTTTFKNFFLTGTKSYSASASPLNGIEVSMTNAAGATWTTTKGSQTGSTFSIISTKEEWSQGNQYIKIMANFSCTLYDSNGANPRVITNGVYIGYFGNI